MQFEPPRDKTNEKKDNKQCLSDNPRWSMKKTNIKNTKAIQNGWVI